ncbi:hypothetical protein GCM10010176_004840 [Nonomuraea spiralis]|nr:hypothetical protein GCM10010176_004840 [Nonomuraea spiralis]
MNWLCAHHYRDQVRLAWRIRGADEGRGLADVQLVALAVAVGQSREDGFLVGVRAGGPVDAGGVHKRRVDDDDRDRPQAGDQVLDDVPPQTVAAPPVAGVLLGRPVDDDKDEVALGSDHRERADERPVAGGRFLGVVATQ